MKYEVLVSEHYATSVVVDADSEKEAMDKVDQGDWYDNDIVKKKLIDSFTVQAEAVDNDEQPRTKNIPRVLESKDSVENT